MRTPQKFWGTFVRKEPWACHGGGWLIVLAGVPLGFLSNDCATLRPLLDEVVPGGRSELKIAQRFNATTEAIVGHACRLPDRKISSGALAYNAPRIRQQHYGRSIIRVER